jgi:hypothetical protein
VLRCAGLAANTGTRRCNRFFVLARRRCFLKPSLRKLRSLQAKESADFGNRIRMIIDSQVEHSTVPRLLYAGTRHNEQCRRLSPANVAAVDFGRFECSDEACSKVAARALICCHIAGQTVSSTIMLACALTPSPAR